LKRLEKRVALLEAQCAADKRPKHGVEESMHRIYTALRCALPEISPLINRASSRNPMVTEVAANPHHRSFDNLLCGMRDRIKASMMTDDDRRVLDALPQEDLSFLGLTAQDIVATYAYLHGKY
jgi:hypothetical protein